MDELVNTFKALSDKTRLRIMFSLLQAGRELCICEIMDTLALAQYNISRHMKELKMAGLVQERKEGRFVFYALRKPGDKVHALLFKALDSFDKKTFADDSRRLKNRLALRNGGKCVVGIKQGCC
jgi:ArsR family transcriptional regulator, arsenate/arsenite/antimonite-responsive transcriptional repressor